MCPLRRPEPVLADHRPAILQIVPHLSTGGAEQSTLEITEAITLAGGRALVATAGGRLEAEVIRLGGEIIRMEVASKNPLRILANARRLQTLARREAIQLFHARSRAPAWSAAIASRRTGIPYIATYHGGYGGSSAIKLWYNGVMTRGRLVIANSHYTADVIRASQRTPEDRIRVIHRGVDLRRFDPGQVPEERLRALRRAWRIGPDQRVVLHAARLSPRKGQRTVIEAARKLADAGTLGGGVIILAGDPQGRQDYRSELQSLIEASGLAERVRLVGHCSDMAAACRLAHVALVASVEPEGFGRTSVEAQAMGCPVIVTDTGATPETVLVAPNVAPDERTGWVVSPGDAAGLAQAMAEALTLATAARDALGRRARRHVQAHFALTRMQAATLAVYDEVLGTRLAAAFPGTSPVP